MQQTLQNKQNLNRSLRLLVDGFYFSEERKKKLSFLDRFPQVTTYELLLKLDLVDQLLTQIQRYIEVGYHKRALKQMVLLRHLFGELEIEIDKISIRDLLVAMS